jgi:excisionase family DNA binding protein
MKNEITEWMGLKQVTGYVNLSDRTVRSWIHDPVDPLPAVRVGGKILIRRSELDAWLLRRRVNLLANVDLDAIVKGVLEDVTHGRYGAQTQGSQVMVRCHRPLRGA